MSMEDEVRSVGEALVELVKAGKEVAPALVENWLRLKRLGEYVDLAKTIGSGVLAGIIVLVAVSMVTGLIYSIQVSLTREMGQQSEHGQHRDILKQQNRKSRTAALSVE